MLITVDTSQPLSDLDRQVLQAVLADTWPPTKEAPATWTATGNWAAEEPAEEAPPAKKAPARRNRKVKAAPDPEPSPESAPSAPSAESADEPDEDAGPTKEDALAAATKLLGEGRMADVKSVLSNFGVKKVSDLKPSQYGDFIDSLEAL